MPAVRLSRRIAIALVFALVGLLWAVGPASGAQTTCPATFHVLHNDHIGKLQVPQGHYQLTLLDDQQLTCERASDLFTAFLEDFDGHLPHHWRVIVAKAQFRKGHSEVGFSIKKTRKHGHHGGRHPHGTGKRCPDKFEVLHNDRIGRLKLPAGEYWITRLSKFSPSCAKDAKLFSRFLDAPSGDLPDHWRVRLQSASFVKRGSERGFRVKPA